MGLPDPVEQTSLLEGDEDDVSADLVAAGEFRRLIATPQDIASEPLAGYEQFACEEIRFLLRYDTLLMGVLQAVMPQLMSDAEASTRHRSARGDLDEPLRRAYSQSSIESAGESLLADLEAEALRELLDWYGRSFDRTTLQQLSRDLAAMNHSQFGRWF